MNGIVRRYQLFGGSVEAVILGKPLNWDSKRYGTWEQLLPLAAELGFEKLYAPKLVFSTTVAFPGDLQEIQVHERDGFKLDVCRGKADGVVTAPGATSWMNSGDCPTVIIKSCRHGHDHRMVALHAGLGCIVDLQGLHENKPRHPYRSIIDAALGLFDRVTRQSLKAFICCGIGYQHFRYPPDHPEYGENNRRLLDYLSKEFGEGSVPNTGQGLISLEAILRRQLYDGGVPITNVTNDGLDTYEHDLLWSHVQHVESGKKIDDGRNGILIRNLY